MTGSRPEAQPASLPGLTGRVYVVTGAGSGIGRATASLLASKGAIAICADLPGRCASVAEEIRSAGSSAEPAVLDVTDREAVQRLAADIRIRYRRLDGWVNSAGIIVNGPAATLAEAELDRIFATNLKGTLWGCQAALAAMASQGFGSIVNLSSSVADRPKPDTAAYAMSKAAVVQLTRVLALEAAPDGIRVNAIAPGIVATGITARHFTRPDGSIDPERKATTLQRLAAVAPLNRVGTPEDIAAAALYLLDDASQFMTGQVLRPNGGTAMV